MPVKNRGKRGKKKRKPTARKKRKPSGETPPSAADRRMMEPAMVMLSDPISLGNPENAGNAGDALHLAQELMYDAWEAPRAKRRIQLAKRALKISDLCADAHSLLAEEEARTLVERREHYERALSAGERALGRKAFKDNAGHFWGILDTRPYMRARAALAECLWECGERVAAIEHLQDMLRLNPNDNQGVRYRLAEWLLSVNDHNALEKLLQAYHRDYSAHWRYSETLLEFRKGDGPGSLRRLKDAWQFNAHVPALLTGATAMPSPLPDYYSPKSPDEAALYVLDNRENWASTEGALPWLAEAIQTLPRPKKD